MACQKLSGASIRRQYTRTIIRLVSESLPMSIQYGTIQKCVVPISLSSTHVLRKFSAHRHESSTVFGQAEGLGLVDFVGRIKIASSMAFAIPSKALLCY